jgi:hypothetical protein
MSSILATSYMSSNAGGGIRTDVELDVLPLAQRISRLSLYNTDRLPKFLKHYCSQILSP